MDLRINCSNEEAKRILFMLIAMELALILVYILIHIIAPDMRWGPARKLFDLDREVSFPAWFSSIQFFVISIILFVASRNNQRKQHVSTSFLIVGSFLFIFLSADESAAIHERITIIAQKLDLNWLLLEGGHGAWITVYFLLALSFILMSARQIHMLWRHFRCETQIALCGAIVFVMGGVGFEIISYLFLRSGSTPNLYKVEVAIEEFLEMSGVSIMIYSALSLAEAISAPNALSLSKK